MMQERHPGTPLTYAEHALAGTGEILAEFSFNDLGSGLCVAVVSTPIDLAKSQLQVQYDQTKQRYRGSVDFVRSVLRNDGISGLWRGFVSCTILRGFFFILWGSYEAYTRLFTILVAPQNERCAIVIYKDADAEKYRMAKARTR
jgi:solute carrier family 25 carnitine/acylcarnitine transporter 20/29